MEYVRCDKHGKQDACVASFTYDFVLNINLTLNLPFSRQWEMFSLAKGFNGDVSTWDTSKVE